MSVTSLKGVINGNFVSALGKKQNDSNSKGIKLDKGDPVDVSLRKGARNFAAGFQALNVGIGYLNNATSTQQKLLAVVDKFDLLVANAAKGAGASRNSTAMVLEFDRLEREFRGIMRSATLQGSDLLDADDLEKVMQKAGLDVAKVTELAKAFKGLRPVTGAAPVASEGEGAPEANSMVPEAQFIQAIRASATAFDEALGEPDAEAGIAAFKHVREQLRGLRKNLEQNITALDKVRSIVSKNMDLAQATGRAMLDLSNDVRGSEEADSLAADLRERIRRQAPQALSQASNLEQIMVAGLTLSPDTFSDGKK